MCNNEHLTFIILFVDHFLKIGPFFFFHFSERHKVVSGEYAWLSGFEFLERARDSLVNFF